MTDYGDWTPVSVGHATRAALSPAPSPDDVVMAALERAAERAQRRWELRKEHADKLYEMDYKEAKIDSKTVSAKADEAESIANEIRALAADPKARAQIIEAAKGME